MDFKKILIILRGELNDKLQKLKEMVPREAKFPEAPGKIKVAMGMRRSGKTYFVYQHILRLIDQGVDPASIFYVNFEDDRLLPLDHQLLARLVDAFYALYPINHERKCYLFLDEIQNIENWPLVIRRIHDTKDAEIFLTGSSAKLLSKEIATSLRGRSLAIEIWPYSFAEFMKAKNAQIDQSLYDKKTQDNLAHLFHYYLSDGGFPEVVSFDTGVRQKVLQEYLDIAVYRDIIERHDIKNPSLIKYMILSLIHNVGKPFSVNKFYNDVKAKGYSVGKESLYEYINYIEDAYLSFSVSLYDRSIRKVQANPKKVYAIDSGMVRSTTLDYESNLGRLFENIIYLELRRQGYKVSYYLTEERYEVDFLIQTGQGQKKLLQVVWKIDEALTLEREKRALKAAMKELKVDGELITLDSYLSKGIQDFLV